MMRLRDDQVAFVERVEEAALSVFARTGLRPDKVQITSAMATDLGLVTGSEVAGLRVEVMDLFGKVIR